MKYLPLITVLFLFVSLQTQSAEIVERDEIQEKCFPIKDAVTRADCYDQLLKRPPGPDKKLPIPSDVKIKVLQKATWNNFRNNDLVDKPSTIDFQRKNGVDGTRVQFGTVAYRPIDDLGQWVGFASAAWNRDATDPSKKKDIRDTGLGFASFLPILDYEFGVQGVFQFVHRHDINNQLDGNRWNAHFNLEVNNWVQQDPFIFIPYFAYLHDKRMIKDFYGNWRSIYYGFSFGVPIHAISKHLTIVAEARRFNDVSVPSAFERRHLNFGSLAIVYEFTDPEDKSISFRPSISISRTTGTDVLSGWDKENKTVASLGVKYVLN